MMKMTLFIIDTMESLHYGLFEVLKSLNVFKQDNYFCSKNVIRNPGCGNKKNP